MKTSAVRISSGLREGETICVTLVQIIGAPRIIIGFYIMDGTVLIRPGDGGADLNSQVYRIEGEAGYIHRHVAG